MDVDWNASEEKLYATSLAAIRRFAQEHALSFPAIFALIVASPAQGNAMQNAISYIRVSSDEQADSGLGLESQRQRIAAYCTMKGLHLAEEFEDPGISAGKPLASRPAGFALSMSV